MQGSHEPKDAVQQYRPRDEHSGRRDNRRMKAFVIPGAGRTGQIVLTDIPQPAIDADEVLVRMQAVGVGSHDRWAIPGNARFPYAIGLEGAGTIEEAGQGVTAYQPGDKVIVQQGMLQPKGGTWAEYAAVHEQSLIAIPNGLEITQAAGIPIAGSTALEGIRALRLQPGNTLFVAGASGAIGTLAIQLATSHGYRVGASASQPNHDYLRELGVELAVDYRDQDWVAKVREWMPDGVDAALAIQPGTGTSSLPVVRDGGQVVTISGDRVVPERQIRVEQIEHHPETRKELIQLVSDVAAGRMRVIIESTYPFEQGLEALQKTEARHARGKTVLTMDAC